jgi:hypothetical protein
MKERNPRINLTSMNFFQTDTLKIKILFNKVKLLLWIVELNVQAIKQNS